jgi:phosphotransacetylase
MAISAAERVKSILVKHELAMMSYLNLLIAAVLKKMRKALKLIRNWHDLAVGR